MDTQLKNLLDYNIEELESIVKAMGQPAFRTKQLWEWLYKGADFSEMTNLPEKFRSSLAENYRSGKLGIKADFKQKHKVAKKRKTPPGFSFKTAAGLSSSCQRGYGCSQRIVLPHHQVRLDIELLGLLFIS